MRGDLLNVLVEVAGVVEAGPAPQRLARRRIAAAAVQPLFRSVIKAGNSGQRVQARRIAVRTQNLGFYRLSERVQADHSR